MKTSSIWGPAPSRIYRFINELSKQEQQHKTVLVVGCSDGKFVFPFLRKGFKVTGIDLDRIALYGGKKSIPIHRKEIIKREYISSPKKVVFPELETKEIVIRGLKERAIIEGLSDNLTIIEGDFYRNPPDDKYDILITSCSLQYKNNRSIPVESIIETLQSCVNIGGYIYMDYMMPLEDSHEWKAKHFFRKNQIKEYFTDNWEINHIYEMNKPVFEAAHVDRASDHFHRFGYILAKKIK